MDASRWRFWVLKLSAVLDTDQNSMTLDTVIARGATETTYDHLRTVILTMRREQVESGEPIACACALRPSS